MKLTYKENDTCILLWANLHVYMRFKSSLNKFISVFATNAEYHMKFIGKDHLGKSSLNVQQNWPSILFFGPSLYY